MGHIRDIKSVLYSKMSLTEEVQEEMKTFSYKIPVFLTCAGKHLPTQEQVAPDISYILPEISSTFPIRYDNEFLIECFIVTMQNLYSVLYSLIRGSFFGVFSSMTIV